jgi:SH3 domain protein
MKKYKNRKDAVKTVVAVLCAVCMLTACGNAEADAMEEIAASVTETTTESAEVLPTEKPAAEPTEAPAKTVDEGSATEPVESVAVTAEPDTKPSAEPVAASAGAAAEAGYTCTEMTQTMYAKSAVNVRDLPSTDGKKIGSLKASQEITVTGKCDQTGWYRFDWNNTTGYVSDKYIVSEKPVSNVAANTGSNSTAGNTTAATQQNTTAPAVTPAPAQTTTTSDSEPYFDRAMAEQVFALVNNDRVANGLNALAWNEDMYNIAVQRCYEGVAGDIHGMMRSGTSENRVAGPLDDSGAQGIYQSWHDSPGHRNNYLNATYTSGAVAIYAIPIPGGWALPDIVSYEVFTWDNTAANSSVTINTPVQENTEAAAPKTADEDTSASSSNVGWSMTPPTQEDGLKKWQEQNPDVEVSFGN